MDWVLPSLKITGYLVLVLLLTLGGNLFFGFFKHLAKLNNLNAGPNPMRAGRVIGTLERILIAVGIIMKSWEIIIAVITLKTVARYQELDKQDKAEYFLVGSLYSLAWALFVSTAFILYDDRTGFYLVEKARDLF